MSFRVLLDELAEQDLRDAFSWYEEHEPEAAQRFIQEVYGCLRTLSQDPERFRLVGRLTRKARIPGWPYSAYFTINSEHAEVTVIAIWHGKRSPARLGRRVR